MSELYQSSLECAGLCLSKLEDHVSDSGTLALHDPVYAIREAVAQGRLSETAAQANLLAQAVERPHPAAASCRVLLGELSELGLWAPRPEDTALEAAIRGIGVDPEDPDAGERLQLWMNKQSRQREFLEEKTDELRIQLRRTERFSSAVVGIAVLLGLLLLVSLLAGGMDGESGSASPSESSEEEAP